MQYKYGLRKAEAKVWGYGFRFSSANVFEIRRDSEFCRNPNANARCLRSSYHCVWSKGIHPRHPPREFPLGLRAPVLGADFAERLKYQEMSRSSKNPQLVGERILLSPVRCLGSCSLRSHSAERNRAHPTRPHKPLSGFSCPCFLCRFRYDTLYCISHRRSSLAQTP